MLHESEIKKTDGRNRKPGEGDKKPEIRRSEKKLGKIFDPLERDRRGVQETVAMTIEKCREKKWAKFRAKSRKINESPCFIDAP